ncbi:MAG: PfkB family carbohydrate kinase, partial [bacterium]|nr:PfkB family carbohydrate kinase [bacterium]
MTTSDPISKFAGKRVVIVGDLVADQFLNGTISRVSREAPVFIVRHDETETRPGGAANTAANVAALGGKAVLIGRVGDDENG